MAKIFDRSLPNRIKRKNRPKPPTYVLWNFSPNEVELGWAFTIMSLIIILPRARAWQRDAISLALIICYYGIFCGTSLSTKGRLQPNRLMRQGLDHRPSSLNARLQYLCRF